MHYWRHLGTVFLSLILHRGKAWLQKAIANCALFLQFSSLRLALAALADKSFISSSMVILFSRFFHTAFKFCCISMRHDTNFLKICFRPSLESISLPTAPKEFLFKSFFLGPAPLCLPPLKAPLLSQTNVVKLIVFNILTFRALLVRICIKIAYLSKCTPRSSRKHILANRCTILFNKNPIFRVGCTSECLLAASGPQSR